MLDLSAAFDLDHNNLSISEGQNRFFFLFEEDIFFFRKVWGIVFLYSLY